MSEDDAGLINVTNLVNKQAEDPGLWFIAQTASEAYLQQALRELHAVIETQLRDGNRRVGCELISLDACIYYRSCLDCNGACLCFRKAGVRMIDKKQFNLLGNYAKYLS